MELFRVKSNTSTCTASCLRMAAPSNKMMCALCFCEILNKKSYRKTDTLKDQTVTLLTLGISDSQILCYSCVNKLNKLKKLDYDILTKVEKLKCERNELYTQLSSLPGAKKISAEVSKGRNNCAHTPKSLEKRKRNVLTPTPKSARSIKKQIPQNRETPQSRRRLITFGEPLKQQVDKSTQTVMTDQDFEVKVTVKYKGIERSRKVQDDVWKAVVKQILNNNSASMKTLAKNVKCRDQMLDVVKRKIQGEASEICKQRNAIFKVCDNKDLKNFDVRKCTESLEETAPYLYQVLSSVAGKKAHTITAFSTLMYGRNMKNSILQYITGLTVDSCGITKEGLQVLHDLGVSVSPISILRKKNELVLEQEEKIKQTVTAYVQQREKAVVTEAELHAEVRQHDEATCTIPVDENVYPPIEMLGDNLDITITPSKITSDAQRKSLHWFLVMMKQKKITVEDFNSMQVREQRDIMTLPKENWLANHHQTGSLIDNMVHSIIHVLVKYIEFLKPLKCDIPLYIPHEFIEKTQTKSVFLNCELIEASENSASGMISIMERVHDLAVPHTRQENKVIERIVFGGDVLTNERAFTAQQNMQLNKSEVDRFAGIIHRPEGLHRQMNFLLGIYQQFYKENSSSDVGSLYRLRNVINRRDVQGPESVINNFRSHHDFVNDVTDAYIIGAFLDNMDLDTLTSTPENLPVFSLMNSSEKTTWLKSEAYKILDVLHINDFQSLDFLHKEIQKLDSDEMVLKAMLSGDVYSCAMCSKQYTKAAWLKKHLEKKHDFEFSKPDSARKESNPVQCFLFMSLLLRDTCDSYRMGDGERIVRNAYFEWLYARSLNHTKYSLWLWRLIAYVDAVLSPSESAEYKWNMTVNLKGGVQNNIPNDCCVELQVKNIKRQLNTQGSNKSFKSAQKICMTTQVVEDIMDKLQKSVKSFKPKGSRPEVDKSKDIDQIVQHLRKHGPVKSIKWDSFSKFKNPIAKISAPSLFEWINYNQKIASLYM